MAMFRSLLNKLRGKSADKIEAADAGANANASAADADADGIKTDTSVIPLGAASARKSVVTAPLPIPSLVNDPLEDEFEDGDAELAGGAINPIAAASVAAHDADFDSDAEAALDSDADFDAVEDEPAPPADPAVELVDDELVISAEALCGIDPESMDREAIRSQLAILYRRHNAAASSLNAELRAEAEQMLDAIVACREAYVDHL